MATAIGASATTASRTAWDRSSTIWACWRPAAWRLSRGSIAVITDMAITANGIWNTASAFWKALTPPGPLVEATRVATASRICAATTDTRTQAPSRPIRRIPMPRGLSRGRRVKPLRARAHTTRVIWAKTPAVVPTASNSRCPAGIDVMLVVPPTAR